MARRITIPAGMPMIMAIPMNATIVMTPGLISKGYAGLLAAYSDI